MPTRLPLAITQLGMELSSLPEPVDSVAIQHGIIAYNRKIFDLHLRYEKAIERVTMMPRQKDLPLGVVQRDGQQDQPEVNDCLLHPLAVRQGER